MILIITLQVVFNKNLKLILKLLDKKMFYSIYFLMKKLKKMNYLSIITKKLVVIWMKIFGMKQIF